MAYKVTFPVTYDHVDEMLCHMCGTVEQILKAMNTTFDHLSEGKITFVGQLPGPGFPFPDHAAGHVNPDHATVTFYHWGEEGPTREQLATAFIDLPSWMVDALPVRYNCIKVEIPLDPNDQVLVEFFHHATNNNYHVRTVHLVNGQWEKLQPTLL